MLFVTPFLPSPPMFGAQRRMHELISGVAAAAETSVLSLADPGDSPEAGVQATEEYCRRVVTVSGAHRGRPAGKRLRQLASLASPHSYEWIGHSHAPFTAAFAQMLVHRYDVVHFELAPMAGYALPSLARSETRPILCLDEHNIEYDLARRTAQGEVSALRRAYGALEWRKLRKDEQRAWRRLDGCTVTSARDQGMLLADEPSTRTAVVANGVDVDFFEPAACSSPFGAPSLLFFGAIDYFPNTDAMLYFLRDVFPRLASQYADLRLHIVGRHPPESIVAQRSASIDVTGVVDDVRPWLERADVVIVPLRIGGGTRLKILEAMAMGKAVVSTTLGAEGLDVVPERDLLLADDSATFVAQVGRLLDDPELRQRLGAAARRLVVSRYGWKASVDALLAFYGELLDTRAATP